MKNKYVDFISDEHLIKCIANLYNSYSRAKSKITKAKFYSNKVDTIKLTFDSKFNQLSEEDLINLEIKRQIDKSITNAIGIFHEEILGGIDGYERGNKSNYDIKSKDNLLFADIKNKFNTMNSSSAEKLYQNLIEFANKYPNSKCYWVQIWAKGSFNKPWITTFKGEKYNNPNVYQISGDKFYELLSGQKDALYQLYKALPKAIDDYLKSFEDTSEGEITTVLTDIKKETNKGNRSIIDQITLDNFPYYLGFDKLKE